MPKKSSPRRRANGLAAWTAPAGMLAGGALTGHTGAAVALVTLVIVSRLLLAGLLVRASTQLATREHDANRTDATVKLIGALAKLIERLP